MPGVRELLTPLGDLDLGLVPHALPVPPGTERLIVIAKCTRD